MRKLKAKKSFKVRRKSSWLISTNFHRISHWIVQIPGLLHSHFLHTDPTLSMTYFLNGIPQWTEVGHLSGPCHLQKLCGRISALLYHTAACVELLFLNQALYKLFTRGLNVPKMVSKKGTLRIGSGKRNHAWLSQNKLHILPHPTH